MATMINISLVLCFALSALLIQCWDVQAKTWHYNFNVRKKVVRRMCHTKSMITINGKFPGPTLYTREGDRVLVNVTNHVKDNVTIHWHGVRQIRTGWADGPAYITQCPIQQGQSYVYNFTVVGQRGTLWWHAHISWLRSTLHGPIVILPKKGMHYPFILQNPKLEKEEIILTIAEWWNSDTESVINTALASGGAPNVSDGPTFNGKPGPLLSTPNCSDKHTHIVKVKAGRTYLVRLVNSALNVQMFVDVAKHTMEVVEIDAVYTKPLKTKTIVIAPGQTTNFLLHTDQKPGRYFITSRAFMDAGIAVDNKTASAILEYEETPTSLLSANPLFPIIPSMNDSLFAANFCSSLRSLNTPKYPAKVPLTVDRNLFFTIGLALDSCPTCPNNTRASANINNVSFVMPNISLLQAHYFKLPGVFTTDFPSKPNNTFNYTGNPPTNLMTSKGTKVTKLKYNETVELVLQDTSLLSVDNHPVHLHGFNFFIVGQGVGNFNPKTDPANYNLVDPPERNTLGVPTGGWAALRWRADNPGMWFMHCHLEVHTTWGLKTAFLVEDGPFPHQSLIAPPHDLPKC